MRWHCDAWHRMAVENRTMASVNGANRQHTVDYADYVVRRDSRTTNRRVSSATTVYLAAENVDDRFSNEHRPAFHATNDVAMHRPRVIFVCSMHSPGSDAMCWPSSDCRHSTMTFSTISLRCCSFVISNDAQCLVRRWICLLTVPHIDGRSFDSNRIYPADNSCYRIGIDGNGLGHCSGFSRSSPGTDSEIE